MRRFFAFVLVQAVVVSTSVASSLHVHDYVGHDHPDHHHGPAAHDHDHPAVPDRDHHVQTGNEDLAALQTGPCDPGRHAVTVSMGCACIPQAHVDLAKLPEPTIAVASALVCSPVPFTDVRVHGPPFDARTPSRAPPLTPHA